MAFQKRICGKWVLAGEHAVLRGCPALVFPLPDYYIDFSCQEGDQPLSVDKEGIDLAGLDFSLTPLLEKALSLTGKTRDSLKGSLKIKSRLPFGAGLGASAALCAGLALLFESKSWIKEPAKPGEKTGGAEKPGGEAAQKLAQNLEDLFHGKSSGMDVASALSGRPILYQSGKIQKFLPPIDESGLPLFLSYSGRRSATIFGAAKVKELFKKDPKAAESADRDMARAAALCLEALESGGAADAARKLREGLELGSSCFQKWGVLSYDLQKHIADLKRAGAIAAKPTGSGLGGYVISLWPGPAKKAGFPLIPLGGSPAGERTI